MLRYGLYLFGSYLTLLAHVDSLVLLTANFDDLKLIAQKFVPEALVENIANFIARASEDNEQNYSYNKKSSRHKELRSEESKDIEDLQSISNEATTKKSMVSIDSIKVKSLERFHGKKRIIKKQKQNCNSKTVQDLNPKKVDSIQAKSLDSFRDKEKKLNANNRNRKQKYDSKTSQYLNAMKSKSQKVNHPKKNKPMKVSDRTTTELENNSESKVSGEYNNVDSKSIKAIRDREKSIKKPKDITDNLNQYSDEEVGNDIFLKARPQNKDSEIESNEDKEESKSNYSNELSFNQSKESNDDELKSKRKVAAEVESIEDNSNDMDDDDGTVSLTTRVEKNEFDQYVNMNYPKSEQVATSGPLALTMVVESRINRPNFK